MTTQYLSIAMQRAINLVALHPDLSIESIIHGNRKPDKKGKYNLAPGPHPEQKKNEVFLTHVLKSNFKALKERFPTARLGKKASICHTANGKLDAKLRPVFIKKEK